MHQLGCELQHILTVNHVDVWQARAPCELQLHTPDLQMMTILEGNYWIIYYLISSWNTAHRASLAGETAPVLGQAEQQAWLASLSNTYTQQITSWCRSNRSFSLKLRGQRSDLLPGWSPAAFLSLQDLTYLSIKDQWFCSVIIVAQMHLTPEALGWAARPS